MSNMSTLSLLCYLRKLRLSVHVVFHVVRKILDSTYHQKQKRQQETGPRP